MTELTQQQRIDRLVVWAKLAEHGWRRSDQGFWHPSGGGPCLAFNPFVDRNDAFLLLEKCERDGLLREVVLQWDIVREESDSSMFTMDYMRGLQRGFMATAKQQTEAVWVAAGLGEE